MTEAVTLQQVYSELKRIEQNMATKKEVESLIETIEFMSNPKTMQQVADSMKDVQHGRVKEVHSVKDMLDEM